MLRTRGVGPRADKTHVTPEDIEQLGEFVHRRRPHNLSDPGPAIGSLDAAWCATGFRNKRHVVGIG